MKPPDDLPNILYYKCGSTVLVALPLHPKNRCPRIPVGATGWKLAKELENGTEWHPLETLPQHWMPFLERVQ
jgi:hypothetical protein